MWDSTHLSFPLWTSERENYFISIHHKKNELQNDPAMLNEIKILIEKSFGLLQVNKGLI
ncbi:MAG: hypothetical protein Ct9H300mP21_08940 [Pseudomonadota bacterium]|nr:MAG: hypothetical protein Ct9H300mP21_08940 [Pseudomonadota bacterium]